MHIIPELESNNTIYDQFLFNNRRSLDFNVNKTCSIRVLNIIDGLAAMICLFYSTYRYLLVSEAEIYELLLVYISQNMYTDT